MNQSRSCYQLIHSMTQSEKRYFTITAGAHRESSDSIRIYKIIEEHHVTHDDQALKLLAGESFIRHFAVKKLQLYHLLLKALRGFHEARSVDFTLKELMMDASILADKALFREAWFKIKKARELAWRYEEWKAVLEALHREYTLIQHFLKPAAIRSSIQRIIREEQQAISQMNRYATFGKLAMQQRLVHASNRGKPVPSPQVLSLPANGRSANSFRSKSLYLLIKTNEYLAVRLWAPAEVLLKKHIGLYDKNPHFVEAAPGNYVTALRDLLLVSFRRNHFDKSRKIIYRLRNLPESTRIRKVKSTRFRILILSWTLGRELAIAMKTRQVSQLVDLMSQHQEWFLRHAHYADAQSRLETLLNMAAACFFLGDEKNCYRILQMIFRNRDRPEYPELLLPSRLLYWLLCMESVESSIPEFYNSGLKQRYANHTAAGRYEREILDLVKQLHKNPSTQGKKPVYPTFLPRFSALAGKPEFAVYFDGFDVVAWLQWKMAHNS